MKTESILVRKAVASDREQILAFTQHTFSWGDYLSRVWDRWLKDETGQLLVAEADGRAVGNLHMALIGNREGWMEGMRVHPDFRRLGIASALEREGQRLARKRGCRVVRLETASTNTAAQAAIVTYGYRRQLGLCGWNAPALAGKATGTREARPGDVTALYGVWLRSRMRATMRGLYHLPGGWRWGKLTRTRLRDAMSKGLVHLAPAAGAPLGFVILDRDDEDMGIHLVVGRSPQVVVLLAEMRFRAAEWGYKEMFLVLPDSDFAGKWAKDAGYSPEDHQMLIYECPLSGTKSRA